MNPVLLTLTIRNAIPADTEPLLWIEQNSFTGSYWKADDFFRYKTVVAEADGQVAGFLVSHQVFAGNDNSLPQSEILNIAVAPQLRRQGVASALLAEELRAPGEYYLEVRESNTAAQSLYRQFGFQEAGRRTAYYSSPLETAIVMKMKKC